MVHGSVEPERKTTTYIDLKQKETDPAISELVLLAQAHRSMCLNYDVRETPVQHRSNPYYIGDIIYNSIEKRMYRYEMYAGQEDAENGLSDADVREVAAEASRTQASKHAETTARFKQLEREVLGRRGARYGTGDSRMATIITDDGGAGGGPLARPCEAMPFAYETVVYGRFSEEVVSKWVSQCAQLQLGVYADYVGVPKPSMEVSRSNARHPLILQVRTPSA